jgi:hypothetical protein
MSLGWRFSRRDEEENLGFVGDSRVRDMEISMDITMASLYASVYRDLEE